MRPKILTVTGSGSEEVSAPYPVNYVTTRGQGSFKIGMYVELVGAASGTYSVQDTGDDITDPAFDPATADWREHSFLTGLTANAKGNYDFPPRAIRLRLAPGASGDFKLKIIPAS